MTATAIGLLGGSFDPIHVGHLQLARDALRQLPLREIRFLPAAQPWQKPPLTPGAQRAQMIALALAGEPAFVLDMHEIERGGPTYTVDTLRALRSALPATQPLVWIMGGDQLERLDSWRDWALLPSLVHIAVARRGDAPLRPPPAVEEMLAPRRCAAAALDQSPAGGFAEFAMTPVQVSATEVRRLLQHDQGLEVNPRLRAAVPAPVLDYIRANRLYR